MVCLSVQVEQCNIQECPCRCKPSVNTMRALLCVRMPFVWSVLHCCCFVLPFFLLRCCLQWNLCHLSLLGVSFGLTASVSVDIFKGVVHSELKFQPIYCSHDLDGVSGDIFNPRNIFRFTEVKMLLIWCHPSVRRTQLSSLSQNNNVNTMPASMYTNSPYSQEPT